jgi:DNA-binding NarL/FixJ family response regulator
MTLKIAIAEDHELVRQGIVRLLSDSRFDVVAECSNGRELILAIENNLPDIVLMDIHMPEMDGIAATYRLSEIYPHVRVIALTALDDETNTIRMLKAGARAYLLKSSTSKQLVQAIEEVYKNGYQFSEIVSGKLIQSLSNRFDEPETGLALSLTEREIEHLRYLCSELTNKEIADKMCVSPRTSEGWSKTLCEKLNVRSRIGLVLFAYRNKLF